MSQVHEPPSQQSASAAIVIRQPRSIFRQDALRQYQGGRDRAVLPRYVAPRTFLCLWTLCALIAAAGLGASFVRLPIYVSGPAIVVRVPAGMTSAGGPLAIAVFLPPHQAERLRTGLGVNVRLPGLDEPLQRTVEVVAPGIMSPTAARGAFGLDAGAAAAVTQPAEVVLLPLGSLPDGIAGASYLGTVGSGEVRVGSRRAGALLGSSIVGA